MVLKIGLVLMLLGQLLFARWGQGSHRYINDAAVDHLPPAMSFFQDHRDYLSEHSVDPDQNGYPHPGYYHYIDIDVFDEFFTGEMPHTYDGMIALYGQSAVEDAGTVPWVIEWWLEDLTQLMMDGSWNDAWQLAAEMGHFVADSHQALHLTENYNGGLTGNYGIHARYETELMNRHLDNITLPDSTAGYWQTPIDSIMAYIEDIYPVVSLVIAADDDAYALDPNHGNTYYNRMWSLVGDTTVWTLNRAVVDVASLWYTAWINAGSPYPIGVGVKEEQLPEKATLAAFPNPFNGQLTLSYTYHEPGAVNIRIYDVKGDLVKTYGSGMLQGGRHFLHWDGLDESGVGVGTGVYIVQLQQGGLIKAAKVMLLK